MRPVERPRRRGQGDARTLPDKPCAVCGRPMAWRRRWARSWEQVKFCSDACRKGTPRGR